MPALNRRPDMAVLASGGMDSACLLEWAARRARGAVRPLYVSFGLRWEPGEWKALRRWVRTLKRPNLMPPVMLRAPAGDLYGDHWSLSGRGVPGSRSRDSAVYLPGRNLLMLSKTAVYCAQAGIRTLAIGTLSANPFADATPKFFSDFSRIASRALGRRIRIVAPFRRLTKRRLIRRFAHLPLSLCFSCLRPGAGCRPCGRCNKCVEWRRALSAAGWRVRKTFRPC